MIRSTSILALLTLASSTAWAQAYTDALYRRALEEQSSAPLYVLVTLRADAGEPERVACVPAPFLLGAIIFEHGLKSDEAGNHSAFDIAVGQPNRVFSFSEPKARANVQPRYGPEILSEVRRRLSAMSDSQLRDEARSNASSIHDLYRLTQRIEDRDAYRDAVAQVLLEHGILVGIADRTGRIYVPD